MARLRVAAPQIRIWVLFYAGVGPHRRAIWRAALYLRNAGDFRRFFADCRPIGPGSGNFSGRACTAEDFGHAAIFHRPSCRRAKRDLWLAWGFHRDSADARIHSAGAKAHAWVSAIVSRTG